MGIEFKIKWLTLGKFHQLYPFIFHMMVAHMPIVSKNDMETLDTERVATTKSSVTILFPLLPGYLT